MRTTEYFQLSLEDRIAREKARSILYPSKPKELDHKYTLADYYKIGDTSSFLEQLRAYQLADILGKYKLF